MNTHLLAVKFKKSKLDINKFRIPGHAGIQGNEEADKLARAGSEFAPIVNYIIPLSLLRNLSIDFNIL